MYDKVEIILSIRNVEFDNKLTSPLIPLLTIFEESEVKPLGTVFRNKNDKLIMILYNNRIHINGFKVKNLNDYLEKAILCIDTIVQNIDIKENSFQFIAYIFGSLKTGRPLFKKIASLSDKLSILGTVDPQIVAFDVTNDNQSYQLLLNVKSRGLNYSLKFEETFNGFGDSFSQYLNDSCINIENNIIPNLTEVSKRR